MNQSDHPLRSVFHLSLLFHHLNKEAERKSGMSVVQWCVLKHLIDMPATSAQELAEATRVHPSTLTQSLKRLRRKKHIFIGEDPKDSRRKIISITRQGKEALDRADVHMNELGEGLQPILVELNRLESHFSKAPVAERVLSSSPERQ